MPIISHICALIVATVVLCEGIHGARPNIVFILTDDQDVQLGGQEPIAKTRKLIGDAGIKFTNMFVSSPLCCPSRSSILTGKYVHNYGAINNSLSGNCSSLSWQRHSEIHAFAPYLKKQGYNTFFAGKYLNRYGQSGTGVKHVPPGWDSWTGLVGNSVYYNYSLSVNGTREKHGDKYSEDYLTNLIGRRALEFLNIQNSKTPFFAMLSTPACHGPWTDNTAPKYQDKFSDRKAPRDPAFNHYAKDKHWLLRQTLIPMANSVVEQLDYRFRDRWRTLLSVDDIVEDVINLLESKGLLNNTYIFYASDNGYHLGQFGLPNDKRNMYEFDIRVPLMVRGPNITGQQERMEPVVNIDLAPTFIELAGGVPPDFMDGTSLKPLLHSSDAGNWRNVFLVEHAGEHSARFAGCPGKSHQSLGECEDYADCVCEDAKNNTYQCVRWLDQKHNLIYCSFKDSENFAEVYDLSKDPYQLENIASRIDPLLKQYMVDQLAKLQHCSGNSCKELQSFYDVDTRLIYG